MIDNSKNNKRLGWVITGSGHFFEECLDIMANLGDFDLFVSKAADEVIRMYRKKNANFPKGTRIFKDTTASSAPVGFFYKNIYHTLVVAPSTSNVPDTVSLPVTARTEPLNVRLPLSSSSPDVPANTPLPDVRSATAADVAETVPPD